MGEPLVICYGEASLCPRHEDPLVPALVVTSPRSVWSSWTTAPAASSATSRARCVTVTSSPSPVGARGPPSSLSRIGDEFEAAPRAPQRCAIGEVDYLVSFLIRPAAWEHHNLIVLGTH